LRADAGRVFGQLTCVDGGADFAHPLKIKKEVVLRGQHGTENFVGLKEMAQIRA
jgi:hypothetical protein